MIRNAAVVGAVVIAVLLSWKDLSNFGGVYKETKNDDNAASDFEKPVAEPKLKSRHIGPTLKFLYW